MGWLLLTAFVFFVLVFFGGYLVIRSRGGTPRQLVPLYLVGVAPVIAIFFVMAAGNPTFVAAAVITTAWFMAPLILFFRAQRLD